MRGDVFFPLFLLHQFREHAVPILRLRGAHTLRAGGALANVPTWTEQGLRVVSANWRSVVGPQGMGASQTQYWDGVFAKLVQQEEWKKDVAAHHFENTYLNSAGTRKLMETQFVELTAALRALGLAK
jgi:putative tricarboxylic transport membrane protein